MKKKSLQINRTLIKDKRKEEAVTRCLDYIEENIVTSLENKPSISIDIPYFLLKKY